MSIRVFNNKSGTEMNIESSHVDAFGDTIVNIEEDDMFYQCDLDEAYERGFEEGQEEGQEEQENTPLLSTELHEAFRKLYLINLKENREDLKEILDLIEESEMINDMMYQNVAIKI